MTKLARLALIGSALAMGTQAAAADLGALAWLGGGWSAETGEGWIEERWAPARGGVMMGTSLSGKGDAAGAYEFMRLTRDADGGISLWAAPGGQKPTRFRLTSSSGREAVFENPAHDFPTRIAYRRVGDRLTATISGPNGAGRQSWTYRRR